ncbi:MAG: hypothetical protein WDO24_03550 [Pseudomonadota bacterium]
MLCSIVGRIVKIRSKPLIRNTSETLSLSRHSAIWPRSALRALAGHQEDAQAGAADIVERAEVDHELAMAGGQPGPDHHLEIRRTDAVQAAPFGLKTSTDPCIASSNSIVANLPNGSACCIVSRSLCAAILDHGAAYPAVRRR